MRKPYDLLMVTLALLFRPQPHRWKLVLRPEVVESACWWRNASGRRVAEVGYRDGWAASPDRVPKGRANRGRSELRVRLDPTTDPSDRAWMALLISKGAHIRSPQDGWPIALYVRPQTSSSDSGQRRVPPRVLSLDVSACTHWKPTCLQWEPCRSSFRTFATPSGSCATRPALPPRPCSPSR